MITKLYFSNNFHTCINLKVLVFASVPHFYNLTIDPVTQKYYEKYLNDNNRRDEKAVPVQPAEDKKIYLKVGKYKVILDNTTGTKTEQLFEVKALERRPSRRGN